MMTGAQENVITGVGVTWTSGSVAHVVRFQILDLARVHQAAPRITTHARLGIYLVGDAAAVARDDDHAPQPIRALHTGWLD